MRQSVFVVIIAMTLSLTACTVVTPTSRPTEKSPGLLLSDFDFLKRGMSLEKIISQVGEPDRDVGFGIYHIQYDLADGRTVELVFIHLNELLDVHILEEDGTRVGFFEDSSS